MAKHQDGLTDDAEARSNDIILWVHDTTFQS